ncbi:hypothetical protein AWV79_07580 [Cupriavidus sp. UYMMa02A]|nr:hypothetical protein AWV79_07580 [Cupriavidus sp. UYMMa02A]
MLRGGPRGAVEALYALQVEEATALRADMREVVEAIRAHAKALESLASQANAMPEKVQVVLSSADVTELHRRLADALTVDIWANLVAHSDSEARRFSEIATRIESSVHAAVQNLQDANAGKPILPPVKADGTFTERLLSRARYCYVHLLRLSEDLQPLALAFASVCLGLTAITLLIRKIV